METARLRLRGWRDADLAPFAALNADPLVMAHFPAVLDRAGSDAAAHRIRTMFKDRGFGLWAVEVPGEAAFIGFVGLTVSLHPLLPDGHDLRRHVLYRIRSAELNSGRIETGPL